MSEDRTVHAVLADGSEVARYDRAGKWFHEHPDGGAFPARPIKLADAVALALQPGARVRLCRPGGQAFDARVRRAQAADR